MYKNLLGVAACLLPLAAQAAAYQAAPVQVTLTPMNRIGVITVHNTDTAVLPLQVQLLRWSHQGDKDVFTPTEALLATPPIFKVAPSGAQIIRLGLRQPMLPGPEQTYRLFLKQLPTSPPPGFKGLQVLLDMSIPVFVQADPRMTPVFQWQVRPGKPGHVEVLLTNTGSAHAQVKSFTLSAAKQKTPLASMSVNTYVFAGEQRSWDLALKRGLPAQSSLTLTAQTNLGQIEARLKVP
ncbi:MAG: fimbrial biogenesis chaperone [Gammaproteobacteria bacterium]